MRYVVQSRRTTEAKLRSRFEDCVLVDVTSRGPEPWVRFSPFFPHGGIPVHRSSGVLSQSVEGLWQGLKVFESADVDPDKFEVTSMKGLKRTVRRFGRCLGHRDGIEGETLLGYRDARYAIYLPAYRWVLEHRLGRELERLRALEASTVVLLDYETNTDVDDLRKPLSHAALVAAWLENRWPSADPNV
ncbi:MAG: hypothetical protein AAGA54_16490 [Myxococcota bacterium]